MVYDSSDHGLHKRLYLLAPDAVPLATTQGHAPALCGHPIPAQGLTITNGPSEELGTACPAGITGEHTPCRPPPSG